MGEGGTCRVKKCLGGCESQYLALQMGQAARREAGEVHLLSLQSLALPPAAEASHKAAHTAGGTKRQ